MSKNFPGSARKYDIYLALEEPVPVSRVLFQGPHRFVIREEFTRKAWEAERALAPETTGRDEPGVSTASDQPTDKRDRIQPMPEVAPQFKYFYGADWL